MKQARVENIKQWAIDNDTERLCRLDPARIVFVGNEEVPVVASLDCPRCHTQAGNPLIKAGSGGERHCRHCGAHWFMASNRSKSKLEVRLRFAVEHLPQAYNWYRNDAAARINRARA